MGKRNDKIRRTQMLRWGSTLILFIILNAIVRLALIAINQGEYTDGVLQLTQFSDPTGIYPPLYTAICWPISLVVGPLWAGRLVSTLFSIAAVIPLYLIALRSFGMRAALYTAMIYTVAPAALRWSPRVMTEATFSFFFWFACERLLAAQAMTDKKKANEALLLACFLGALAALTRYQGMMLVVPVVGVAAWQYMTNKFIPWKGLLGLGLFALPMIWSSYAGNIHGSQFAERAGDNAIMTIILNAEPFFLLTPYFLTYPVALMVMIGLNCGRSRPKRNPLALTIYTFLALLVAQSLFGSFQERYLLPVYGLLFTWAGLGLAVSDDRLRRRHSFLRPFVPITVLTWSAVVSVMVLLGSRGAFGDAAQASRFAASNAGEGVIFTNEIYRPGSGDAPPIAGNKVAFFASRQAIYLDEGFYSGVKWLTDGDILVMSDIYGGDILVEVLREKYELELLGSFRSQVRPIFPDIMSTPGTAQNPHAFMHRYYVQSFRTDVYRVVRQRWAP